MENNVADAKLAIEQNFCILDDIEHCEKGVIEVSYVNEEGEPIEHLETDYSDSYPAYYYCKGCMQVFDITAGRELAWTKVKEHLSE